MHAYSQRFARLGEAWLQAGATGFEIYLAGECVWRSGDAIQDSGGVLASQQMLDAARPLDLRVGGVSGAAVQRRLAIDAELVAEAVRLDDELQQMTGELIDAQDQLLALYGLARATRRRLSLDAVLTELVAEVRRLTGADVAFAALAETAGGSLVM